MPLRNITAPAERQAGFAVLNVTTNNYTPGVWVVNGATGLNIFDPAWNPEVYSHYFRTASSNYYYAGTRDAILTVDLGAGNSRKVTVVRVRYGAGSGEINTSPMLQQFQFQGSHNGSAFTILHRGFCVPHWRSTHYKGYSDIVIPPYEDSYRFFRVACQREGAWATTGVTLNGWDFFDGWPDTEMERSEYDINWYDIVNARAFGTTEGYPLENLFDDDLNNSWRADTSNSYVEIELSEPKLVNLIKFCPTRSEGVYDTSTTVTARWEVTGSNDQASFDRLFPEIDRPFFRITRHNDSYWPYLVDLVGVNSTPYKYYRFRCLDDNPRINELAVGHMGRWSIGEINIPHRIVQCSSSPAGEIILPGYYCEGRTGAATGGPSEHESLVNSMSREPFIVEGFTGGAAGIEDPDLGMPVIERLVHVSATSGASGDCVIPFRELFGDAGLGRQGHGDAVRPAYDVQGIAGSPANGKVVRPHYGVEAHAGGSVSFNRPFPVVVGTSLVGAVCFGDIRIPSRMAESFTGANATMVMPFPGVSGIGVQSVMASADLVLPERVVDGVAMVTNVALGECVVPGRIAHGTATINIISFGSAGRPAYRVNGFASVGIVGNASVSVPARSVLGSAYSNIIAHGNVVRPGYVVVGGRSISDRFNGYILRYRSPE